MKIGNIELKNKIIIAPLAGYTNIAYRKIYKEMGASLVFSEMISAKGLLYENDKTWELTNTSSEEHPVAIQLFGGDASDMHNATLMLDKRDDIDIIDINMGCPVRKVLKAGAGSAIIEDPKKVYEIVKAVVSATSKPVTVKIRAGVDHNNINCVEVARMAEDAGAKMITIHGRTRSDMYRGKVNLEYIKMVKEAVKIPVVGNGDIKTIEDAKKMIEYTGCDAIMIGRATIGNPWFIRDLVDYFNGEKLKAAPTSLEKIDMMEYQFNEMLKIKSEKNAVLEMRTLANYYVKGFKKAKELKMRIVSLKTKNEFYQFIKDLKKEENIWN